VRDALKLYRTFNWGELKLLRDAFVTDLRDAPPDAHDRRAFCHGRLAIIEVVLAEKLAATPCCSEH
jgi:hypothetical protein